MRRIILLLVGIVSVSPLLVASTARAVPAMSVSISASPRVLPLEGCFDHPYAVAIAPDPGVSHWSVDTSVRAPDDELKGSDHFEGYDSTQVVATGSVLICAGMVNVPGGYTVSGVAQVTDAVTSSVYAVPVADISFTPTKPRTKTTLSVIDYTPQAGEPLTFTIYSRSRADGEGVPGGDVVVQRLVNGGWWGIKLTKTTLAANGRAKVILAINADMSLRAALKRSVAWRGSQSKPVFVTGK